MISPVKLCQMQHVRRSSAQNNLDVVESERDGLEERTDSPGELCKNESDEEGRSGRPGQVSSEITRRAAHICCDSTTAIDAGSETKLVMADTKPDVRVMTKNVCY
jgi:hypothetical protein